MPDSSPAANPASADVTRAKRLALAFQSVFGTEFRRSSDQRIVIDHIRKCGAWKSPIFTTDAEGRFDPMRAAHLDGARTISLIIERQLEIAASLEQPAKKPNVKKP